MRYCRAGAGEEKSSGKCDTPGFPLQPEDIIEDDGRGFKILNLKRTNSMRFVQSSMYVLQSWRANSDVKILLYDTDPYHPDMKEISRVVDYIVAYTCKGHFTLKQEQELIIDVIKRLVTSTFLVIFKFLILFICICT